MGPVAVLLMPLEVGAAVLFAALLHAGWNAAAKSLGRGDPMITTSAIAAGGATLALPLLLLSGFPAPASHPHVVASGLIHVVYFVLVGAAYRSADYSAIYPVTRGSAPLITAALAALVLGEIMSAAAYVGIFLLGAGVLGLGLDALRKGGLDARSMTIAALNILIIVTYTLVDGAGTRASGNPAGYVLAMMALTGLMLLPVLLVWMGAGIVRAMAAQWRVGILGGAMVGLSYGIVLWAMTKAPIGALVLQERFGAMKWVCAGMIALGLIALRIGQ